MADEQPAEAPAAPQGEASKTPSVAGVSQADNPPSSRPQSAARADASGPEIIEESSEPRATNEPELTQDPSSLSRPASEISPGEADPVPGSRPTSAKPIAADLPLEVPAEGLASEVPAPVQETESSNAPAALEDRPAEQTVFSRPASAKQVASSADSAPPGDVEAAPSGSRPATASGISVSADTDSAQPPASGEVTDPAQSEVPLRTPSVAASSPPSQSFGWDEAEDAIENLMKTWVTSDLWKHCVNRLAQTNPQIFKFESIWSIPTRRRPIPSATASVFFSVDASTHAVTYILEAQQLVHKSSETFKEKWLEDLLEWKRVLQEQTAHIVPLGRQPVAAPVDA
eukprot:m.339511 g.339511  ORF g.339511 m.339511 type:complete len:343 (-) comp55749_c0_seq3:240-1268(-)